MTIFHPVQTHAVARSAPEPIVLSAYEVYCYLYGPQPAIVDVAKGCRGGFSVCELIAFLYARSFPQREWEMRVDEAFEKERST